MKPVPALRPPQPPPNLPAPFILVTLDAAPHKLDLQALEKALVDFTSVKPSVAKGDWETFARAQQLMISDQPILSSPHFWFLSSGRWFAVQLTEAQDEAHVYFGLEAPKGAPSRHTHIDIVKESRRWLTIVTKAATPLGRWCVTPAKFGGYASVGGTDSGIYLQQRQSFLRTLWDKETAGALSVLFLSFLTHTLKNSDFKLLTLTITAVGLVVLTLAFAAIRHNFILDRFKWSVDGLDA
jgi:hypothetical protein